MSGFSDIVTKHFVSQFWTIILFIKIYFIITTWSSSDQVFPLLSGSVSLKETSKHWESNCCFGFFSVSQRDIYEEEIYVAF